MRATREESTDSTIHFVQNILTYRTVAKTVLIDVGYYRELRQQGYNGNHPLMLGKYDDFPQTVDDFKRSKQFLEDYVRRMTVSRDVALTTSEPRPVEAAAAEISMGLASTDCPELPPNTVPSASASRQRKRPDVKSRLAAVLTPPPKRQKKRRTKSEIVSLINKAYKNLFCLEYEYLRKVTPDRPHARKIVFEFVCDYGPLSKLMDELLSNNDYNFFSKDQVGTLRSCCEMFGILPTDYNRLMKLRLDRKLHKKWYKKLEFHLRLGWERSQPKTAAELSKSKLA